MRCDALLWVALSVLAALSITHLSIARTGQVTLLDGAVQAAIGLMLAVGPVSLNYLMAPPIMAVILLGLVVTDGRPVALCHLRPGATLPANEAARAAERAESPSWRSAIIHSEMSAWTRASGNW